VDNEGRELGGGLGVSDVRSTVDGSEAVSSARDGSGGASAGLGWRNPLE